MKAKLIRHEKFVVRRRYIIEISVHQMHRSERYSDGLKGPHIHIDDDELPYDFQSLDQLVSDFRRLIVEHLGVQI